MLISRASPILRIFNSELIRMIEQYYSTYYKELCGYNLNMETKHSLIFNMR